MHSFSLLLLALVTVAALAADFPPPDQLPARKGFPDLPIAYDDVKPTARRDWAAKGRPELKRLFQHYMYGWLPPAPARVEAKLEREDAQALGGKAILREVT